MWLCKRNLSKECEGKYKNCTDCVLDKIRAEIAALDEIDYDFEGYYKAISDAVEIIDKYKAESKVEAWNTQEGGDICDTSINKY